MRTQILSFLNPASYVVSIFHVLLRHVSSSQPRQAALHVFPLFLHLSQHLLYFADDGSCSYSHPPGEDHPFCKLQQKPNCPKSQTQSIIIGRITFRHLRSAHVRQVAMPALVPAVMLIQKLSNFFNPVITLCQSYSEAQHGLNVRQERGKLRLSLGYSMLMKHTRKSALWQKVAEVAEETRRQSVSCPPNCLSAH